MLSFISENLNKYFELSIKINEEINKERIKINNNIKKYKSGKYNYFFGKIQKMNENLINDIKKFISIKNNFESKDKNKKSILSHLEDAIKQETEY